MSTATWLVLFPTRQNGLEMRRLFLARHDADFDFLEPGFVQPAVQITFRETGPAVAVKLARLPEIVLEQIENQNLSARPEDFVGGGNRVRRNFGVMQCLAQNHEVNTAGFNRRVLQITPPEFQVLQPVLLRFGRAERNDLFRIVHRNDLFAAAREQFAQQTLARAKVSHGQRRQNAQQQIPERLPRPARAIDAVKAPGDLVEINLRLLPAAAEDAL